MSERRVEVNANVKGQPKKWAENRKELAEKYFTFKSSILQYSSGNGGIVSLLSDCQEMIGEDEHYCELLNDIKSVLIADEDRKERELKAEQGVIEEINKAVQEMLRFSNDEDINSSIRGLVEAREELKEAKHINNIEEGA